MHVFTSAQDTSQARLSHVDFLYQLGKEGVDLKKNILPRSIDNNLKIYIPRKGWGLIEKDVDFWTTKLLLEDYDNWSDHLIDQPNAVYYSFVKDHQNECLFYCSDFQTHGLIDIRPKENSSYVRSSTEPFNDKMI